MDTELLEKKHWTTQKQWKRNFEHYSNIDKSFNKEHTPNHTTTTK